MTDAEDGPFVGEGSGNKWWWGEFLSECIGDLGEKGHCSMVDGWVNGTGVRNEGV